MPHAIVDGQRYYGVSLEEFRATLMTALAERVGVRVPPLTDVSDAPPLPARINWARWIVDCPHCASAVLVWLSTPLMLCLECWNESVGGRWRRVALPPDTQAVEAALAARPRHRTRNFEPGETVEQLEAENAVHRVRTQR